MNTVTAGEDPFPLRRLRIAGDGDPFPLLVPLNGKPAGTVVKGRGTYRAIQIGPFVRIYATGMKTHVNADAVLVPSLITLIPPTFGLFFYIPQIDIPMEAPFSIHADMFTDEQLAEVVVVDADGKHKVPVHQAHT